MNERRRLNRREIKTEEDSLVDVKAGGLNRSANFQQSIGHSEGIRSKKSKSLKLNIERAQVGKRSPNTNNREKWRQQNVNIAFVNLRRLVPTYPPDKRLSKNEILRMAIKYIRLLESILDYNKSQSS